MTLLRLRPGLSVLLAFAWSVGAAPVEAQLSELSLEVGASRVTPPTDLDGDAGRYLIAGTRVTRFDAVGTGVSAFLHGGRSTDEASGGSYVSAGLGAQYWRAIRGRWAVGLEVDGLAFDVGEPFDYRALAVEGGPVLQFRGSRITGTLRGVAGLGRSRADILTEASRTRGMNRRDDPATVLVTVDEELWRYGAEAEVLAGRSRLAVGVAGGLHHTPAGDYRSVGARLLSTPGAGAVELRLDHWDTPLGPQTTGGLSFVLPLGGWSFRGFFGRSDPDPLTLAEPGRDTGGVLVSRRVLGGDRFPDAGTPLYSVDHGGGTRATVTIEVEAPAGAGSVEVLGDFTLWEPVAMARTGEGWGVSLEAPAGVHHFGFLVDGTWFLPDDAPDAVPDEWGRMNATMVIER